MPKLPAAHSFGDKIMIILGIDLGHARTGLAVCDKTGFLASPAGVIAERKDERLLEKLAEAAKEKQAELIVVGHPKNMDGTCGQAAQRAESMAAQLEEMTKIKTVLWDERCTTMVAHNYLNATDTRGKKRKKVVDEVAAVVILQSYLDSLK